MSFVSAVLVIVAMDFVLIRAYQRVARRRRMSNNRRLVAILVVASVAMSPAIGRVYEPRPDPVVQLTAAHAHNLRTILNEWRTP